MTIRSRPHWIVPLAIAVLATACSGDDSGQEASVDQPSPTETTATAGTEAPSVVGMTEGEAVSVLSDAGITVQLEAVEDPEVDAGVVVSQTPEPGARVLPEESVRISVSSGSGLNIRGPIDLTDEQGYRLQLDFDIELVLQTELGAPGFVDTWLAAEGTEEITVTNTHNDRTAPTPDTFRLRMLWGIESCPSLPDRELLLIDGEVLCWGAMVTAIYSGNAGEYVFPNEMAPSESFATETLVSPSEQGGLSLAEDRVAEFQEMVDQPPRMAIVQFYPQQITCEGPPDAAVVLRRGDDGQLSEVVDPAQYTLPIEEAGSVDEPACVWQERGFPLGTAFERLR